MVVSAAVTNKTATISRLSIRIEPLSLFPASSSPAKSIGVRRNLFQAARPSTATNTDSLTAKNCP